MSKIRRQLSGNTSSSVEPKRLSELKDKTGNLYESITIIAKRANQINITIKEELHNKLEEFASHTDSLEEIHENKEQIEISRTTVAESVSLQRLGLKRQRSVMMVAVPGIVACIAAILYLVFRYF